MADASGRPGNYWIEPWPLFLINLEQFQGAGRIKADNLLLAGMGEPGRFAQDSLQFVMSNIVVATKVMGHNECASSLIGTRRNKLSVADPVRGLVEGIQDGYERIRAIADDDTKNRETLRSAAAQPLSVVLVHAHLDKSIEIEASSASWRARTRFPT